MNIKKTYDGILRETGTVFGQNRCGRKTARLILIVLVFCWVENCCSLYLADAYAQNTMPQAIPHYADDGGNSDEINDDSGIVKGPFPAKWVAQNEFITPFGKFIKRPKTALESKKKESPAEAMKRIKALNKAAKKNRKERDKADKQEDKTPELEMNKKNTENQADKISEKESASPSVGRGAQKGVILNFDNAELIEVFKFFSELLNFNYIVEAPIQGSVTIRTTGEISQEDIFPIFHLILEANRLAAVKDGDLYRIVAVEDTPAVISSWSTGRSGKNLKDHYAIRIIKLKYIQPEEMISILSPFIPQKGAIFSHKDSKTLLLVGRGPMIEKALSLVKVFDVDFFSRYHHRLFNIVNVDAEEAMKMVEQIMDAYKEDVKEMYQIIPFKRSNKLLAITSNDGILDKIGDILNMMDVPVDETNPSIHVYFAKNSNAKELASVLKSVFGGGSQEPDRKKPPSGSADVAQKQTPLGTVQKKTTSATGASEAQVKGGIGMLKGDLRITTDEVRNSIIITAIPSDYQTVVELLEKIDILPRQVLIEVTVAEISLDESTELGLEWSFLKNRNGQTNFIQADINNSGLAYKVGLTDEWLHTLTALAKDEKINVLSAPRVLASDNKTAKINISTKIPVASAEYQYQPGAEGVIQTNIQYRDTGLILSVTPHINEHGLVSMEINQESSQQGEGVDVGGNRYPSFRQRKIDTVLTVKHEQTIVIGGLMEENKTGGGSGVPFLNQLPLIGFLFGKESGSFTKTELIVMITPKVISTLDDIDQMTREYRQKLDQAIKKIASANE